ncbi:AraC family transcriptional regulator [Cellulophaga baltica]|uniref:AraC family transcriptional regulator n=1 Tax=Cellulophaga baltica TaxID=76594 RepID=UPI00214853DE|nr:helix-turn-helix domain-containing protein [Cellulophaga baltica]MCR1027065.1 AraC family transcriptional regulator [Cellulophaga baltica]
MRNDIENIIFSRFVNQPIPFEFISIKELYRRCKESNYDLSNPHRIKFNVLIIITEGESFHTIDFKKEILSPGVILPLTKDQVHSFNKDLNVKGYVISFEENFITENISEKNLFHFLHIYHTPSILIGKENMGTLNPFLQLLENLHLESNNIMKAEIINSVFMALLFQIKRLSIYQHKTFESQRFKDFILFKQLITEFYHESHNAKDYAEKLAVSYKYLNDICKQIGHKTAKAFLDSWLLLEAKRNISENKYTSQEIAYKMGFKEPSNFIRFFKKFTNLTPNQFQQNLEKTTLG